MKYHVRRFASAILLLLSTAAVAWAQSDASAAPAANSIETLQVSQRGGNTVIKVGLSRPLATEPASFSVANPARVVYDFQGTTNNLGRTTQAVNDGDLRSINIVQVGDRTRLVLNLLKLGSVEPTREGNAFLITLGPAPAASKGPTQHFAATAQPVAGEARSIRDLRFRRGKAGEAQITIDLSDPSVAIDVRQQAGDLIVDFQRASLPDNLARKLDVTDFATPVTTVSASQHGENARVVISPKGLWEHTAYQSERQFVVEVKPVKEDPSKLFQGTQRQGYQGEKVSLNFQNIPLRELLHVFADITNFNIVISDSVTGNVSLRLNDIPWDQALEIVLKQKGLAMRKTGNVIWIAPGDELAAREKLDLESRTAIAELEPLRTESFQLNYQRADVVEKMLRGFSTAGGGGGGGGAQSAASAKQARVLSDRGHAIFDQRTNKLFVTDTPTKLGEIRRLVSEIDIPVRQVLIEARIVEASDTFSKSLGVRLGGSDNTGLAQGGHKVNSNLYYGVSATSSDVGQLMPWTPYFVPQGRVTDISDTGKVTFVPLSPSTSTTFKDAQFVNLPASNAAGQFALSLFSKTMGEILNLEISAMEADGRGKTVSSPRVLTADQVEAEIRQGTRTPYLQSTSSGATAISYQDAVLSLKVRPQITPDNRVMVALDIHKDALGTLIANLGREIDTKAVKTDVLVDNGGTVVIGGIFVQEESNDITRVPLLGDLPVLGFMFRKTDKVDNRRELLIFITPKIVSESLNVR
jgi:type IV pilus assembly protein PilQ